MKHHSAAFPVLDGEQLLAHPKASKTEDIRRILHSPQSEDWVTWNVMRLLQRRDSSSWWPELVNLALAHAPVLDRALAQSAVRVVDLWRLIPSPPQYELASRRRLASSDNTAWRKRAANPKPVEGATEVDCVLEGEDFLVFVEAKLHSDISSCTTYDPMRNQIARNIDCVIEEAGSRRPYFWMIVRDRLPGFQYTQLVDSYREDRGKLATALSHRVPVMLSAVVDELAIMEWRELLPLLPATSAFTDVLAELRRRVA